MTYPVRLVSATCAVLGLACAASYTAVLLPGPTVGLATWSAWGVLGFLAARFLVGRVAALLLVSVLPAVAAVLVGRLFLVPSSLVGILLFGCGGIGSVALATGRSDRASQAAVVRRRVVAVATAAALLCVGTVLDAGAWSVDEPAPTDPRMVAGNGVVVDVDTHAFLVQQGAAILRADGHRQVAEFLASPDPTAPRIPAGRHGEGRHESYVWRVELGARDADRVLKHPYMPDHFFNWWTHSGKGLVAGASAATYAEQQFGQAVSKWRSGDRAQAMYHLGAATHLVDDACAPPHELFLVPNHRAYEERMLALQDRLAVRRGGIYQHQFRVRTGHGGPEWSSAHTRGWVDECSHRAAELVLNTAQQTSGDRTLVHLEGTFAHFRDTQRLTAGYLVFFFDTVGYPASRGTS